MEVESLNSEVFWKFYEGFCERTKIIYGITCFPISFLDQTSTKSHQISHASYKSKKYTLEELKSQFLELRPCLESPQLGAFRYFLQMCKNNKKTICMWVFLNQNIIKTTVKRNINLYKVSEKERKRVRRLTTWILLKIAKNRQIAEMMLAQFRGWDVIFVHMQGLECVEDFKMKP